MILFRFRAGLKEEIQRELLLREVTTLQHVYQLAQELDRFFRLSAKKFDPTSRPTPSARPQSSQASQSFSGG